MTSDTGHRIAYEFCARVSLASRVLGHNGHDDYVWGHVSARDPLERGAWIKASGRSLTEVEPHDVMLVDRAGDILSGHGPRHVEYPIHTEIFERRPDVRAVVHSHPPHAIALAASDDKLVPISHAATMFVPPNVPRFRQTSNLIVTAELGGSLAEALGDHSAIFLLNHGIVTVGPDLETAVVRAVLLEVACEHQLLTRMANRSMLHTDDDEALAKRGTIWHDEAVRSMWSHLVRNLPRRTEHGGRDTRQPGSQREHEQAAARGHVLRGEAQPRKTEAPGSG